MVTFSFNVFKPLLLFKVSKYIYELIKFKKFKCTFVQIVILHIFIMLQCKLMVYLDIAKLTTSLVIVRRPRNTGLRSKLGFCTWTSTCHPSKFYFSACSISIIIKIVSYYQIFTDFMFETTHQLIVVGISNTDTR